MLTQSIARYPAKRTAARALLAPLAAAVAFAVSAVPALAADRTLSFAVSGVVLEVTAKAGQTVQGGAVLARLDARPFAAGVEMAKAAAQAAEMEAKFAAQGEVHAKQLFDDLSASAEEYERAQLRHAKARADLAAAKAKLVMAQWRQEQAVLKAPGAGTVVAVPGFVGQAVNPRAGIQPVVVLSGK